MSDTEKKAPLQSEFTPVGEVYTYTIKPAGDGNFPEKNIEVQFGHYETWREGEEPKKSHRFETSYPRVIDGMEDHIVKLTTKADKGLEQVLKLANNGTIDDYVVSADWEDDYFKQKLEKPKEDKDDVWTAAKFSEVREELTELRAEAEEALAVESETAEQRQVAALHASTILNKGYVLCGENAAAMGRWIAGNGDGSNMPHLARLGTGANALREALKLAQLSEAQFAILPHSITSGKGVETHTAKALTELVSDAAEKAGARFEFTIEADGSNFMNASELSTFMRMIAHYGFGIGDDEAAIADTSLAELTEAVNKKAAASAVEFKQEMGKDVNTYDEAAYKWALKAFGRVTASAGGADMFAQACEVVDSLSAMEEAVAVDAIKKLVAGRSNLMMRRAHAAAMTKRIALDNEQDNREIMEQTENDKGPISDNAVKGFGKLEPGAAGAHLFKLLMTRKDHKDVKSIVDSLYKQYGSVTETAEDVAAE